MAKMGHIKVVETTNAIFPVLKFESGKIQILSMKYQQKRCVDKLLLPWIKFGLFIWLYKLKKSTVVGYSQKFSF